MAITFIHDGIGIDVDEEGNADYVLQEFSRTVCGLELLCGKNFGMLDPIHVEADLPHHLINEHPLRKLIEWKLLELSFNPFNASAPTGLWISLNKLVGKELFLDPDFILQHLALITLLCTQISVSCIASCTKDINLKILCMLITKLQEAEVVN
eukprot:601687-Rhodomonas_salina.1